MVRSPNLVEIKKESCRSAPLSWYDGNPPLYYSQITVIVVFGIRKDSSIALTAFADADHAGCQASRRSTFWQFYNFWGVRLEYHMADIFTKALGRGRIDFLINKLGMLSFYTGYSGINWAD
ncbi:hypothetical protein Tco_0241909 [Tanacetum coccineum]